MIKPVTCKRLGLLHWVNPATIEPAPLSAASGLIATARSLWVVADDLLHLVRFDREAPLAGRGFKIFSGELPEEFRARKRTKPDTECLIGIPSGHEGMSMLAFPSGSKPQRNRASKIWINGADEIIGSAEINISSMLDFLDKRVPDLNIEGGVVLDGQVVLLQRGNGESGFNGVISFGLEALQSTLQERFNVFTFNPAISEVTLPVVGGVTLTFTDACTHMGTIYFSAAAESGSSTYEDGQITASVIGRLTPNVELLAKIDKVKVEGLAVAEGARELTFLAVTDADDPSTASQLLEITAD